MKQLIWIGWLSYFLIGMAHVVLGSVLPTVLDHYNQDYSKGGTLIFTQFAGFLVGTLLSPSLSRRFSKRGGLMIATGVLCVAELLFTLQLPWGYLYVIASAAGFGFGTIEVIIGTILIAATKHNATVVMSRTEVFFGLGALIMPLVASELIKLGEWRLSFLVVFGVALVGLIFWAGSSFGVLGKVLDKRTANIKKHTRQVQSFPQPYRGQTLILFILFVMFFFLYVGVEMSITNFMPAVFIEKMGLDEATAAISVTCFWITMSIGRIFAGILADKFTNGVYIFVCCFVTAFLLMIFPFTHHLWMAFGVVLLLGLSMSGLFSIALVFASRLMPGAEESTPSIMIASGGVGGAVLPLLTGWNLDHLEVEQSVWILGLFFVGLFIISVIIFQWQRKQQASLQPQKESL